MSEHPPCWWCGQPPYYLWENGKTSCRECCLVVSAGIDPEDDALRLACHLEDDFCE